VGSIFNEEQEAYLNDHKWAVLATGRADGSPQVSQIAYAWNGSDIVISIKSYTAKWKNARRQPKIALLIHDDRKQLVVYGEAECIDQDPLRAELATRVFRVLTSNPDFEGDDNFIKMMDEQQRTILRIKPTKAFMND
jgi:PPOX class probable F420-dependent enzyme